MYNANKKQWRTSIPREKNKLQKNFKVKNVVGIVMNKTKLD